MIADYSFLSLIQDDIDNMELLIRRQVDGFNPYIHEALDIIMKSGGKRIRPIITFLVGHMVNSPYQEMVSLAASIELLHTATLVHDDLIDGALLRRGSPTLNSQWSASSTVLTGDFLFACAAKLAGKTNSIEVLNMFADTLQIMVNGEISQQLNLSKKPNRDDYFTRIYAKTASLFETATSSAALLSKDEINYFEELKHFGREIGIAFQIIDDILDFTGDASTIGKPVGSDLRQGLITLPTLVFYESPYATPENVELLNASPGSDPELLDQLVKAIRDSDAIQKSKQEAMGFLEKGISRINNLPRNIYKDALEELAFFIVDRNL